MGGTAGGHQSRVTSSQRSDAALVRAARLGDTAAFAAIVDRHGPSMRRYARLILGSDDDASDATQDALISAWRNIDRFRGDAALRTWLFTLVSRRAADLQRRRKPTPVEGEQLEDRIDAAADNALEGAVEGALVRALRAALGELPWPQRATWLLREIEGMSYEEIGETLGMTTGSVRGHLYRGRGVLAQRMEAWR